MCDSPKSRVLCDSVRVLQILYDVTLTKVHVLCDGLTSSYIM